MKRLLLFAALLAGVVTPPFTIGGLQPPITGPNTIATIADDCSACATQVSSSFAPQILSSSVSVDLGVFAPPSPFLNNV